MKQSQLIWTVIFAAAAIFLGWRFLSTGMGEVHVYPENRVFTQGDDGWSPSELTPSATISTHDAATDTKTQVGWTIWKPINKGQLDTKIRMQLSQAGLSEDLADDPVAGLAAVAGASALSDIARAELQTTLLQSQESVVSFGRTLGVWIAAMLTIFIMSFLYRDNPLYKLAESIVVGSSAAYVMAVSFWTMIVPNLFANLAPDATRELFLPGLPAGTPPDYIYLIPAVFIILLLWRLMPFYGWISRWPLAFFIGITAGLRLVAYLEADFMAQVKAAIMPLWVIVTDAAGDVVIWQTIWASFTNIVIFGATLTGLVYFFFSVEHKGVIGKVARVGIWFLMITFGAGFGYTVMGRIALLAERLQFLFGNWLGWVPPV
jgi:hypothetical protein